MGVDSSKQLKWGALLSYGQMILSVVIGLVYHPVMIRLLGKSEYGLYSTVSSVISLLSILNLGFNTGYIRYYAKYKKEGKQEDIYKLNGLFMIIFIIIGIVALACSLFLTFNLRLVFDEGLTPNEYSTARVLMLLLGVNLSLSFPLSVFTTIISAHERFVLLKVLGMIRTVLSPLLTLPLLLLGYRSIAMVATMCILSTLTDICYWIYVKKTLKEQFIFRNFEKGVFRSLFIYTAFIAVNLIVDQINWNIDKFLLGRYKGTEVVAVYSVGYSLYTYYMMMSTSISGVFAPRVHRIVNETNEETMLQRKELTEIFTKVGRVQFLILGLVASGIVFFGKPFIYYWAGEGYENAYWVALLLIIPASIALIQNMGIEIQRALNKHKFRSIVYLGMALLNLISSIFLCQYYGAIGAAIGTAISLVFANGLIMNIYYHCYCNIDIIKFWKNVLRLALGGVPSIILGILMRSFLNLYSVWMLLGCILLYTVCYCLSMWFIGMNQYEKDLLRKTIYRMRKNNK